MVVQDAWRLLPWADVMYGCDDRWWHHYNGVPEFAGEKWSTHGDAQSNNKRDVAEKYGVNLVQGANGVGFSYDPGVIFYGDNSGFQAIQLALHLGATYIVLVGFNMSHQGGKVHFFGDHPAGLHNNDDFERWVPHFDKAAETLPDDITIVNATWPSALKCFPCVSLEDAIEDYRMHRHRAVAHAGTG